VASDLALSGRTAIVTGAGALPGRGMGRAISSALTERGARVLAVDIDEGRAKATAALLRSRGHDVTALRADASRRADIEKMVQIAVETYGGVDILINHAGFGSYMSLLETDDEHWNHMISVNLTGPFMACRAVVPIMMKNPKGGVIINTISSAGMVGGRAGLGYTSAKHGMVGLTKNIAVTYATRGIRCVGVCPGYTRSPLPEGAKPQIKPDDSTEYAGHLFDQIAKLGAREGAPHEIANIIGFLATDEASFVNGAIVAVDGGWTAI
jgi:NAD(P)-dependent dehydrogenase (short-subunit alcohol dehydrogenase family)